jgi:hypothetical protein
MDDAVAAMLLSAFPEQFERHVPKPKPAEPPQWRLRTSLEDSSRVVGIQITIIGETIMVGGPPDGVLDRCGRALAGRKAPLPPPELISAYRAAWERSAAADSRVPVASHTPPPRPKGAPAWKLHSADAEVMGLSIMLQTGEVIVVDGSPEGIVDRCERALAGRKAPLPPDELVARYRELWRPRVAA